MLSYCWLRSPDGKIHTVVQNDMAVDPPALKYVGATLELGDCSATIRTANKTDSGYWTCHMGVVNGSELETGFKVFVTGKIVMLFFIKILRKSSRRDASFFILSPRYVVLHPRD